ncbi:hypothetical protein PG999_001175 [Apiospora kogelbergensis]|uniref:Tetratricopeptide repeat-containing protein n=1 Tax=Apiospora kogelbergensis TaxID=1337665 RepID=A0AAW0RDJ4_9PEZI
MYIAEANESRTGDLPCALRTCMGSWTCPLSLRAEEPDYLELFLGHFESASSHGSHIHGEEPLLVFTVPWHREDEACDSIRLPTSVIASESGMFWMDHLNEQARITMALLRGFGFWLLGQDGQADDHGAQEYARRGAQGHAAQHRQLGPRINNQGRYGEAEELLVQMEDFRIRVLGRDHPHTLSGMSNLGVSYHNQGRWKEVEAIQSEVVAARKRLLGPEHFSTLTSMAHLSLTSQSQGRRAEAEVLGLQVMECRKKVLSPEHHHTLTSIGNLASLYSDDGQLAKAEELFCRFWLVT